MQPKRKPGTDIISTNTKSKQKTQTLGATIS